MAIGLADLHAITPDEKKLRRPNRLLYASIQVYTSVVNLWKNTSPAENEKQ